MSFIWPPMLVLLVADPARRRALRRPSERRRRARMADLLGHPPAAAPPGGARAAGRCRRRIPAALLVVGMTVLVLALARPAERRRRPALRGHRDPGLRRVGQHGRDRHRADPDGGGQDRRPDVRRAPAAISILIGVVAFSDAGFSILVADRRPGRGPRGDRPPRARARHLDRPRHPVVADGDRRARAGPAAGYYTNRSPDPDPPPTPCRPGTYDAGGIVLLQRRREQPATRPAGPRQAAAERGVRIFTVGLGTADGHDARGRGLQGPQPARRGGAPADRRARPAATYYAAADPARPGARSTTRSRRRSW